MRTVLLRQFKLRLFIIYVAVVASLLAIVLSTNVFAATESVGEVSVTFNNNQFAFSGEIMYVDGTDKKVYRAEDLSGSLSEISTGVYSGVVQGNLKMFTMAGGIIEVPTSYNEPCRATATLNTSNNENVISFSDVECGVIDSLAPGKIQGGTDLRQEGQESGGERDIDGVGSPIVKGAVCQLNLGLSWLTCGFTDNILMINNVLYKAISSMLEFPKKLVANGDAAHGLWNVFRMAANTVLLAAFIVIIFSQATSIGLSAYGVKKLLPRVMAFAIIINLSFFISQLAIDVSNIAGAGINRTIATMAVNAGGGVSIVGIVLMVAAFLVLRWKKWNPILVMLLCGVGGAAAHALGWL